jgi:hypothetical protein
VGIWYIESPLEDEIKKALEKPYYPLSFGKAHMLASIRRIEQVSAEPISGIVTTKTCAPTDEVFIMGGIVARMPSFSVGYRQGDGFENVVVPIQEEITLKPKYGALRTETEIIAIM